MTYKFTDFRLTFFLPKELFFAHLGPARKADVDDVGKAFAAEWDGKN